MIDCGSLELTQARVQARHGQRLDAVAWQQLQTPRDFGALLAAVRDSTLRPWVAGLTPTSDAARIETAMRRQWHAEVDEVAGWMPAAWHAAVAWCAALIELPALQHLARGGAAPGSLRDDAAWRPLLDAPAAARRDVLQRSPWAALTVAWTTPSMLGQAWLIEWQRRAPTTRGDAEASQRALLATLRSHQAAFATAPAGPGEWLRRELQARLRLQLRRASLQPALAFVHLALCALDLERLRGELLRRALFSHAKLA